MTTPLDELEKIVSTCTSCKLHCTRTQTVFSRGDQESSLMIIGEAPDKDDDAAGEAFVGKAGQLLSELLAAGRVPEDKVYLTHVLKCAPPKNRFPEGSEAETCRGYLLKQIEQVKPKAVILTGAQALKYTILHGTSEIADPLNPWINKQYRRKDLFGDIRFLVVYHPAYLQRRNDDVDNEAWVSAVSSLWSYVEHKIAGTAPAITPFEDIRPPPIVPRQGRNLFNEGRRRVL